MAMHVLENEFLKVAVADAGAELSSVEDKESGNVFTMLIRMYGTVILLFFFRL